jgi:predicted lipoprotein with Yx(FWY)xxD motif
MLKRRIWLGAVALSLLLAVLPHAALAPTALAAPPSIGVAKNATLGNILTDGNGMTLYVYKNDTAGQSTCTGGCAQTWPPLLAADETQVPALPAGVTGKLGAIDRPDGKYQLAFNDMPVYLYSGDAKPGDVNGQGIGGVWSALATNPPSNSSGGPKNNYQAPSGNSYGSYSNSYNYSNSYGYGMNGYGMNGYGGHYSYVIPYRPYVPRFHYVPLFRRFPSIIHRPFVFHSMPFRGMMGMRRY